MGNVRQFGELIQFSDAPGNIDTAAPRVGENTKEILTWLGYDDAQIDALFEADVINWPQAEYPWAI
jgi:crotonobetainyl-CoA:carnitine CoA-transferase CaiB-like acyl-CoA transferase